MVELNTAWGRWLRPQSLTLLRIGWHSVGLVNAEIAARATQDDHLEDILRNIALQYPPDLVAAQLSDVNRIAFHIRLIRERIPDHAAVCDVGGGVGLFSIGCAALGMDVLLIDDFADNLNERYGSSILDLHRRNGVQIITSDVLEAPPRLKPASLNAVTSFDVLEHLHHSPRPLLRSMVEALLPGGTFLIATPNCANLRKRVMGVFGKIQWSEFDSWYNEPTFRGHVREPDINDLRAVAHDLKLEQVRLFGRNWLGYENTSPLVRMATWLADDLLVRRPSLCSNLYLLGIRSPGAAS